MCGGHTDRCRTSRDLPCSRILPLRIRGAWSMAQDQATAHPHGLDGHPAGRVLKEAAKLSYMLTGIRADLEADAPTVIDQLPAQSGDYVSEINGRKKSVAR